MKFLFALFIFPQKAYFLRTDILELILNNFAEKPYVLTAKKPYVTIYPFSAKSTLFAEERRGFYEAPKIRICACI
jgi:hypothetical protein